MVAIAKPAVRSTPAPRTRAKTISVHRPLRLVPIAPNDELFADRPQTRGQCATQQGPCPWVSCKHHLYLDVNPDSGSVKLNFPDLEVWELEDTCALDVAERGGLTLEEVGATLNVTRERIRQVEVAGLLKLRRSRELRDADDDNGGGRD